MPMHCSVPQCFTNKKKNKALSFFSFPKDSNLKKQWIIAIKTGKEPNKWTKVCSRHFAQEDFISNEEDVFHRRRLKENVIPHRHLPLRKFDKPTVPRKVKMVMCFVPDCRHYSQAQNRVCKHFFRFPTNEKLKKKWIKSIRRGDKEPSKFALVCSCHFKDEEKENGPTIFKRNTTKMLTFTSPEKRQRKPKKSNKCNLPSTLADQISSEIAPPNKLQSIIVIHRNSEKTNAANLPSASVKEPSCSKGATYIPNRSILRKSNGLEECNLPSASVERTGECTPLNELQQRNSTCLNKCNLPSTFADRTSDECTPLNELQQSKPNETESDKFPSASSEATSFIKISEVTSCSQGATYIPNRSILRKSNGLNESTSEERISGECKLLNDLQQSKSNETESEKFPSASLEATASFRISKVTSCSQGATYIPNRSILRKSNGLNECNLPSTSSEKISGECTPLNELQESKSNETKSDKFPSSSSEATAFISKVISCSKGATNISNRSILRKSHITEEVNLPSTSTNGTSCSKSANSMSDEKTTCDKCPSLCLQLQEMKKENEKLRTELEFLRALKVPIIIPTNNNKVILYTELINK